MRSIGPHDVLALAGERAAPGPATRALVLLVRACPEHSPEAIAATPLSARDRALLALRATTFGPVLQMADACDACGETIEFSLAAGQIGLSPLPGDPFPAAPDGRFGDVPIRALTAGDAAAAESARDPAEALSIMLARAAPGAASGPELAAALERLDPEADIALNLQCPACGVAEQRAFDAPRLVLTEIDAQAPRIMRDVIDLARAFHWSESDILDLPAHRRAFYLAEARA